MRILVDQSGYDLLNIGDVAMLQSCVARLQMQWPTAQIMVIAHQSARLSSCCPGALAIRTIPETSLLARLPRKARLGSEQAWKVVVPYLSNRFPRSRPVKDEPLTTIQAVAAADIVVASGGAYITDTWWWHAAGVFSLLSMAQRLGKPTAMFGQGLGPMNQPALRMQARTVFPHLTFLGLREDQAGRDLAMSLGAPSSIVAFTGDDAFETIDETRAADGKALGLNIRVASYANVDFREAATVCALVSEAAAALDAPVTPLPVSRHAADADVLATLLQRTHNPPDMELDDIESPHDLSAAVATCRAIVTGSYHAAVFGLAQGVPTVCLAKSSYYGAKFHGLQAQFPTTCFVVPLTAPDSGALMRSAIERAWQLPVPARVVGCATATRLRRAGRDAYGQFRAAVEKRVDPLSALGG